MFFEPTLDETLYRPQSTPTWLRHAGYLIRNDSAVGVTDISVSNFQPIYNFLKHFNIHFVTIVHAAFFTGNSEMKGILCWLIVAN